VAVPRGIVADAPQAAAHAFRELGGEAAVVKAQIHAGGRGKGVVKDIPHQRGVQVVRSVREAAEAAANLLGHVLVTVQTGPEGRVVRRVLVEQACHVVRELYLGIAVDRAIGLPVLMASCQGGMDIEQVAARNPEAIFREPFHPDAGLRSFQARKLARRLGLSSAEARRAEPLVRALCRVFVQRDCGLVEINPLVLTSQGELLALDAKMSFDSSALFRQPDLVGLRDLAEEQPAETRAAEEGLSYVKLDGNIGCLVNGAGLAMSTMDIIKLHRGMPANFLDVGGSVTPEGAVEAFRIILADPQVKAVLVNIFGGIARCDVIADALIQAAKEIGFKVPVVVRLEGTNVDKARKMLQEANLPQLRTASDLTDAAKQVCAAV
jgi:succinyl-CoA synthetase beta subunit